MEYAETDFEQNRERKRKGSEFFPKSQAFIIDPLTVLSNPELKVVLFIPFSFVIHITII